MNIKKITALSFFLLLLLMLSACGSAGSTSSDSSGGSDNQSVSTTTDTNSSSTTSTASDSSGGSSNQSVSTTTDANSSSTVSMLECEAMPNVKVNGNIVTAYTMPNIPDPNSFTGISGTAPNCVAGYSASDGTTTVNVPSNLPGCQSIGVTNFQTGSVIPAYLVPDGDDSCIATN